MKFFGRRKIVSVLWLMATLWAMAAAPGQQATPVPTPTPPPTPTPGQNAPLASTWSAPQRLSPEGSSAWFPDVLADATGLVHVVWSSGISLGPGRVYDAVMYTTTRDGQTWQPQQDVAAIPTKGAVTRAVLAIDPSGMLHMAYRSYSIYYGHAPAANVSATTLSAPFILSTPEAGYFSRLIIDRQGHVHALYTENIYNPNCNGCFHAFHRVSEDGGKTWSEPQDITPLSNGVAKPQVVLDADGNFHITFEIGRGGDLGQVPDPSTVGYIASYNGGASWTQPLVLAAPDDRARNIAIGQTGAGTLIVAWLSPDYDQVHFRTSADAGRSWSDIQTVPGVWGAWSIYQGRTDVYMMTTDSAGVVHLLLVGRTARDQKTLSVLHLLWNGEAWSEPEAVTTITDDAPEWPRLAIGAGNQLHLVWFVRNKAAIFDSDNAQYQVWYARGEAQAPAATLLAEWPTPTPTAPSLTATPKQAATVTPTRAIAPLESSDPVDIYSETNYLIIAAEALVPVLGLLGVVWVVARLRRRG